MPFGLSFNRTKAWSEVPVNDYHRALGENGQLIDVREPSEAAAGTIPGAVNIPLGELPSRLGELDPARPVVLLCRSGARSGHAADFLSANGFADVTNLTGGMLAYNPTPDIGRYRPVPVSTRTHDPSTSRKSQTK